MRISDWSSDVCSSDLFTYLPVLSHEPESGAWAGERGFVHEMAHRHFGGDFRGHKAYLCGPPLMIEACISTLMQGRLFERDIYTEKFISAADAQQVRSPLFTEIGRASCRESECQYV